MGKSAFLPFAWSLAVPHQHRGAQGQINFPATANPSTNASTLDDYREGTSTPAFRCAGSSTGVTMTGAIGNYVKVGRLVFFNIELTANISGATSGDVTITGLPFTPYSSYPGAATIGWFYGLGNGTVLTAQVQGNPNQALSLYASNAGGTAQAGNTTILKTANLGASIGMALSGCYMAQS